MRHARFQEKYCCGGDVWLKYSSTRRFVDAVGIRRREGKKGRRRERGKGKRKKGRKLNYKSKFV